MSAPDDSILSYESPSPANNRFGAVRYVLVLWQIFCGVAIPFGFLVGGGGTYVAVVVYDWNASSVEDWIGFILWTANAVVMFFLPWVGVMELGSIRRQLQLGNIRGISAAHRLLAWAYAAAVCTTVGLLYGCGKAVWHRRFGELPYWLISLVGVGLYFLALGGTRRLLFASVQRRVETTGD